MFPGDVSEFPGDIFKFLVSAIFITPASHRNFYLQFAEFIGSARDPYLTGLDYELNIKRWSEKLTLDNKVSCYHTHKVMDIYFMGPFMLEVQVSFTDPAVMPWKPNPCWKSFREVFTRTSCDLTDFFFVNLHSDEQRKSFRTLLKRGTKLHKFRVV